MDTDYFFLCPSCGKLTIATGTGDPEDLVTCHECGGEFKAYLIAGVGKGISIAGKNIEGLIDRVYLSFCSEKTIFTTVRQSIQKRNLPGQQKMRVFRAFFQNQVPGTPF